MIRDIPIIWISVKNTPHKFFENQQKLPSVRFTALYGYFDYLNMTFSTDL